jgi:dipeptidyl aminopeptidase/acylaminoacyl peptidase
MTHALSVVISLGLAAAQSPAPALAAKVSPDVPQGADAARDAELGKKALTFIDAFFNGGGSFSPDGKQVIFISNRDGLPQMYLADAGKPGAPPRRVVSTNERIDEPSFLPDGTSLLFRMDRGADENWSIFRVAADGSGLTELTPGEKLQRDAPIVPRGAPGTMLFSARLSSEPGSRVYAAAVERGGGVPRLVYSEKDKPGFLIDVSHDGKVALYATLVTATQNIARLVDVASGTARVLYPGSGAVRITDGAFSGDGRRVFLATDAGADQALVLAFDVVSGKEVARYVEKKQARASLTLATSKAGDHLAIGVNAGDHYEVRLLDARSLAISHEVKLPLGWGALNRFSDDGRRLAVSWSTPATPTDLWSIDTASGKATPLRRETRPSLKQGGAIRTSLASADAFDGGKIPVNVYLPAAAQGKKLPVIVSYHGGPAGSSSVRWNPLARFYLSLGYAWVEPNVRGSSGFGRAYEMADNGPRRLDAFKDIESSARWAASQPWADRNRLVVFGGSYGGYTTLVALTRQPDIWRAGVDLFGVANLATFLKSTSGLIREVFRLEFGELEKDGPFLDSISPLRDIDKIVDPLFVYAGANDPRVPRSESDLVVAAARKKGIPCEYMVADNEGHSLARKETQIQFYARSARFLEKELAKDPSHASATP